jgi:K+-transporting ATPase KdpF subunit
MPAAASASEDPPVTLEYIVGAALSVALAAYLVYALLRPERF